MKTIGLIYILLCCGSLAAWAQAVHLSAGDTFSFGFNGTGVCRFTEFSPGSAVAVSFGPDLLEPGESLRLEMFENSLNDLPFAAETYTPSAPLTFVALYGPRSAWLDFQGLVRVTSLSGSVDLRSGDFLVSPTPNTSCEIAVAVPEPMGAPLMGIGAALGGLVFCLRRKISRST